MDDLPCPYLLNCLGNPVPTEKVLKNKKVVVFYFSASFCKPCEELLPKLRLLQEVLKKNRRYGIVIVYVSFDTDEKIMIQHFKDHHHGWYCIPLGEPTIKLLELKYNISYLPQIIVVKLDGTIVTRQGKRDLDEHGNNVVIIWSEPDVTSFRYCPFDWITMSNNQRLKRQREKLGDGEESGEESEEMGTFTDASQVTIKSGEMDYEAATYEDENDGRLMPSKRTSTNSTMS